MARPALIESLRSQAARDLEAIRAEARADAERYRAGLAARLEEERARLDQLTAAEVRRIEADGTAAAERKARELRAVATVTLADRLRGLAGSELPQLRGTTPARLFEALARELPQRDWQRVRVNPADVADAGRCFPGASIEGVSGIAGGMDLECDDGRIRISNTLETRLAIAWPDLLPELIAHVASRSHPDGTAA
jgi:vacuolar-type H+-ATPase subunit E/Vma4